MEGETTHKEEKKRVKKESLKRGTPSNSHHHAVRKKKSNEKPYIRIKLPPPVYEKQILTKYSGDPIVKVSQVVLDALYNEEEEYQNSVEDSEEEVLDYESETDSDLSSDGAYSSIHHHASMGKMSKDSSSTHLLLHGEEIKEPIEEEEGEVQATDSQGSESPERQ